MSSWFSCLQDREACCLELASAVQRMDVVTCRHVLHSAWYVAAQHHRTDHWLPQHQASPQHCLRIFLDLDFAVSNEHRLKAFPTALKGIQKFPGYYMNIWMLSSKYQLMCKLLPNESLASGLKSYGEKGTLMESSIPWVRSTSGSFCLLTLDSGSSEMCKSQNKSYFPLISILLFLVTTFLFFLTSAWI